MEAAVRSRSQKEATLTRLQRRLRSANEAPVEEAAASRRPTRQARAVFGGLGKIRASLPGHRSGCALRRARSNCAGAARGVAALVCWVARRRGFFPSAWPSSTATLGAVLQPRLTRRSAGGEAQELRRRRGPCAGARRAKLARAPQLTRASSPALSAPRAARRAHRVPTPRPRKRRCVPWRRGTRGAAPSEGPAAPPIGAESHPVARRPAR